MELVFKSAKSIFFIFWIPFISIKHEWELVGSSRQHVKDTCYGHHVGVISRLRAWPASVCIPESSRNGCSMEGIVREEESTNSILPNEMTSSWKAKLGVWEAGHLKETRILNIVRKTFSRWPEGYKYDCVSTAITFHGSICFQVLTNCHTRVTGYFSRRNLSAFPSEFFHSGFLSLIAIVCSLLYHQLGFFIYFHLPQPHHFTPQHFSLPFHCAHRDIHVLD